MSERFFCFTVDDNIRVFKDITERDYGSIFEHPYLAMYKMLHEAFDLKVQLNLFYRCEGFDLSMMSDVYSNEWAENSDWLKLSFHSELENVRPYEISDYDEVKRDCDNVHREILRFAGKSSLARTTTVHYCVTTAQGLCALKNCGVGGLLGLFGTSDAPRTSYGLGLDLAEKIREGGIAVSDGISFSGIDIVLNCFSKQEILRQLRGLIGRNSIRVMIHEQYFYPDYFNYQPDFEQKLIATFDFLRAEGYESAFFENII